MNVFLYIMIFIAGTVFGSFFSLAVYRIPRKENIVYVQSHCTSCNHKLYFWDLIPVFSYLFLKGRCRYCHEKIRPRYLLLEVFSGLVFLSLAYCNHISIMSSYGSFISLGFVYLLVVGLFIIGGIDKEKYLIPDSVCLYLVTISCLKILYVGFSGMQVIDNLMGFILIPAVLMIINLVCKLDISKEEPIGFGDIKYIAVIGLFIGFGEQLIVVPLSLLIGGIGYLFHHYKQIPWGYYLSIATIIVLLLESNIQEVVSIISFGT